MENELIDLICFLERRIGNECHNANSYNGWTHQYGKSFRYPIYYKPADCDSYQKTSWSVSSRECDESTIHSMHYKFGSNQLNIGAGLLSVIKFLEERYGLNFAQLEKEKKAKDEEREKAVERFDYWVKHGLEFVGKRIVVNDSVFDDEVNNEGTAENSDLHSEMAEPSVDDIGVIQEVILEYDEDDSDMVKSLGIRIEYPETGSLRELYFWDGISEDVFTIID